MMDITTMIELLSSLERPEIKNDEAVKFMLKQEATTVNITELTDIIKTKMEKK